MLIRFIVLLSFICRFGFAAEEDYRMDVPTAGDISVHGNARLAEDQEDKAAKKNKSIGTGMIAAGTAMIAAGSAMTPPNMGLISAGMAMVMMGGQALQTGANMNNASGMSANTGDVVSGSQKPNIVKGADGSSLASRESSGKVRKSLKKLEGLGYAFDETGALNGPNGVKMDNVPLNSEKDLIANGVPPKMASKVMAAASKAALEADKKIGASKSAAKLEKKVYDSEIGEADGDGAGGGLVGGGGTFPAAPSGSKSSSSKGEPKVSGKFRKVGGGDRIAVASDNIFDLMKKRYQLKKLQGAFIKERF